MSYFDMICPEDCTQNTDPGKHSAIVHWTPTVANGSSGFLNATSDYTPGDIFNIFVFDLSKGWLITQYTQEKIQQKCSQCDPRSLENGSMVLTNFTFLRILIGSLWKNDNKTAITKTQFFKFVQTHWSHFL